MPNPENSPVSKKSTADRRGGGEGPDFRGKNTRLWELGQGQVLKGLTPFLGQDQAWSELQLVNFIQWSEFSKYPCRALKVELFYFSQQELLYKKICIFESTEKKYKPS